MKRIVLLLLPMVFAAIGIRAQEGADPRALNFMGIPLEGPVDSVAARLKTIGFSDWGASSDESELHFRGDYYGIRAKLMVTAEGAARFVSSAYVTVGPYGAPDFLDRNFRYYRTKLEREFGDFTERDGALYHISDYGIVKLSVAENETGSRDIKVFYFPTAPYYKDGLALGLRGNVQEVVTDNPVIEAPVEHFDRNGRIEQTDLIEREYSQQGYLLRAAMKELSGSSELGYTYDAQRRPSQRLLVNQASGVRSVVEFTYADADDVAPSTVSQKVFDASGACILSILLRNDYTEFDDNDNWTTNNVHLTYWEKDNGTQQAQLVQKRTISYWE